MKYLIFISLLICYILCVKDVKAEFTRENCLNCCNDLIFNKTYCVHGCIQKFMRSQQYNSRAECNRSCLVALDTCREPCLQDCLERFEEDTPGVRAPQRREREKRKRVLAREAKGDFRYSRSTKDPKGPKRKYVRKKKDDSEGGSNVAS